MGRRRAPARDGDGADRALLVFLYDLLQVWRFHLVVPLWGPADAGGMGQPDRQRQVVELYQWFAADVHTARLAFGVLVVAVVCLAVGLFSQVAALVALLVYAQLARVLPEADRGIDLLIRNVLFLFVFVPSGRFAGLTRRSSVAWSESRHGRGACSSSRSS